MIRACFEKVSPKVNYPSEPPFDPHEMYPEFSGLKLYEVSKGRKNDIYPAVRGLLIRLGLDRPNQGTSRWNPFREFANEGGNVLIKPNLVHHSHPRGEEAIFWTISHPSVVRVFMDYAQLAVGPTGRINIGDTPIENCEFEVLCRISKLGETVRRLKQRGIENISLVDFRTYETTQFPDSSIRKKVLDGDPEGYTDIDLGDNSLFYSLEKEHGMQNYYTLGDHSVDHIDPHTKVTGLPNRYHSLGRHVYRIPNTILDSDFVINIAKMKTHKFSGVTLCLKNAVGICQGKEYLPHRRPGTPEEGGDSFPVYPSIRYVRKLRAKRAIYSAIGGGTAKKLIDYFRKYYLMKLPHEKYTEPLFGDWHGNDTVWRMTLDLNLILLHARRHCLDLTRRERAYFGCIDGVVGMDHEAPMSGLPVQSGILIGGLDPVAIDTLGTYLMGFDPRKIRTISRAMAKQCRFLGDTHLCREQVKGNVSLEEARCRFVPTQGWRKYLADEDGRNVFEDLYNGQSVIVKSK